MEETFSRFDAADYLTTDEHIFAYLEDAAIYGDPAAFAAALSIVLSTHNMSQLAQDTGMTSQGIYEALSPNGNPAFSTVVKVARAMGFDVTFRPRQA
jgi:probable addiction module antidote protein